MEIVSINFTDIFKNTTIERLRNDESKMNLHEDDSYLLSYFEFTNYFLAVKEITRHEMVIGIHFAYGWMPTIFRFGKDSNFDDVIRILNNVKRGAELSIADCETLKKCFHNSIVGTSKLLHFISPANFAIWDSKVYRYITGKEPGAHVDNTELFLEYTAFMKKLVSAKEYEPIHTSVQEKLGYTMTKLRTAELIMFTTITDLVPGCN